ncbi:MAG TPA: carboxypeptidase-like regulatory domain-containing protein, partial [Chitinophagaceae bacterium]
MLKLQKLFLIPLLLISIMLNAQTRTIRGKVVSSQNNQPISGAAVQVKDKSIGTITNNDGSFSLNVPAGAVTLVISNVGYTSVERAVEANASEINVTLAESSGELNTVVVTALGITKNKRNLNYSTQTVDTKDMTKARETNVA